MRDIHRGPIQPKFEWATGGHRPKDPAARRQKEWSHKRNQRNRNQMIFTMKLYVLIDPFMTLLRAQDGISDKISRH